MASSTESKKNFHLVGDGKIINIQRMQMNVFLSACHLLQVFPGRWKSGIILFAEDFVFLFYDMVILPYRQD